MDYTVHDLAIELKISEQQIRNYIKAGKLKATQKKRGLVRFSYVITLQDITDFKKSLGIE